MSDRPCKHAAVPCPACRVNRARAAAWAKRYPERARARGRRFERNNPTAAAARKRRYDAKMRRTLRYVHRARGRYDVAAERIDVRDVWDDEFGACWLCRGAVPHPDEPAAPGMQATLDHVWPLAWRHTPGHVRENVRLAHVACNTRRGARMVPEADLSEVPF